MRAQSVSEGFFKFLALMFYCLSQRDNPHCIFAAFDENHNDNPVSKQPDAIPTIFAISFSRIESRPHRGFKDFPSIGKIKAVFADILLVFVLIPFKVHRRSLTMRRFLIQEGSISRSHLTLGISGALEPRRATSLA